MKWKKDALWAITRYLVEVKGYTYAQAFNMKKQIPECYVKGGDILSLNTVKLLMIPINGQQWSTEITAIADKYTKQVIYQGSPVEQLQKLEVI